MSLQEKEIRNTNYFLQYIGALVFTQKCLIQKLQDFDTSMNMRLIYKTQYNPIEFVVVDCASVVCDYTICKVCPKRNQKLRLKTFVR